MTSVHPWTRSSSPKSAPIVFKEIMAWIESCSSSSEQNPRFTAVDTIPVPRGFVSMSVSPTWEWPLARNFFG